MKVLAITQARFSSQRLPKKILLPYQNDQTFLELHLKRLKLSNLITQTVVAVADEAGSEKIIQICESQNILWKLGSVDDVLDRFYKTAIDFKPEHVARLTSDCPLIDSEVCDRIINSHINAHYDYTSNVQFPTWPDGFDFEIMKFSVLQKVHQICTLLSEREHVTLGIRNRAESMFQCQNIYNTQDDSDLRMTLDTEEDRLVLTELIKHCGEYATASEFSNYLRANEALRSISNRHQRNEGLAESLKKEIEKK